MYERIGDVPDIVLDELERVLKTAKWSDVIGSGADFKTCEFHENLEIFPDYYRAFFLMIPAGGKVHRHRDTSRPQKTYHIPITTNDQCKNNMYPGGSFHLEVGGIYEVDRQIEHDSVNNGKTDRIHLLVEI